MHKFCKVAKAGSGVAVMPLPQASFVLQFRIVPCSLQWFYSFSKCIPNGLVAASELQQVVCRAYENLVLIDC